MKGNHGSKNDHIGKHRAHAHTCVQLDSHVYLHLSAMSIPQQAVREIPSCIAQAWFGMDARHQLGSE
jgi:hypothetical protein